MFPNKSCLFLNLTQLLSEAKFVWNENLPIYRIKKKKKKKESGIP